jgi:hypothetical protein
MQGGKLAAQYDKSAKEGRTLQFQEVSRPRRVMFGERSRCLDLM